MRRCRERTRLTLRTARSARNLENGGDEEAVALVDACHFVGSVVVAGGTANHIGFAFGATVIGNG